MHSWWECRLVQPLWKTVWNFLKKLKMDLPFDSVIPLLGISLKEPKTLIQKNICISMFIAALFTIVKIWTQPKCSTTDEWMKQLRHLHSATLPGHLKKKKKERKKNLRFATVWTDLENIMLCEISQSEEDKYHMISLICGIQ